MALDVFGVLDEGRLVVEEGRTSISVTYFVLAVSQLQALARLRDRRIERGAVYESLQGEAVSFGLVARELEVMVQKGKGVGSEGMYYVKVLFETPGGGSVSAEPELLGPPVWRLDSTLEGGPVDVDASGRVIANSAGEPLDPPLSEFVDHDVIRGGWWIMDGDFAVAGGLCRAARGKLNAKAMLGAVAGSLLCRGVRLVDEVPGIAWRAEGTWEYREPVNVDGLDATVYVGGSVVTGVQSGWLRRVVDRGRRELGAVVEGRQTYKNGVG